MRILSIGNSFSEDAHMYLHDVAALSGVTMTTCNLPIGGCSLARHYRNMLNGQKAYAQQVNGEYTGFYVSLEDVFAFLAVDYWDAITFQQVSHQAPRYETYQPYLSELVAFARKYSPKSKIYLQETWAYEQGSPRLTDELHYEDQADMYRDVHEAYKKAAEEIRADGIIPSGTAFQHLYKNGAKIHRDTFHASLGIGRLTLATTWTTFLTGIDTRGMDFSALKTAEPVTAEEIVLAQEAAYMACHS